MRTPLFFVATAVAASLLMTSACLGTDDPSASPGSKAPSRSDAAEPEKLTGKELNRLLLPAKSVPKGLKLDPDSVRNTGDTGEAALEKIPASKLCDRLGSTSWSSVAGVRPAAFAQNYYIDAKQHNLFGQEIETYEGSGAQTTMAGISAALAKCASFTSHEDGVTAKVTVTKGKTKSGGLKATISSPVWEGGATLVALRVDDAVVTVIYDTDRADRGVRAVALAEKLAKRVQQARQRS
ncbi:hypothetical protein ABGB12_30535 [Actinocorallia sp. B10E7]|uniref:hypothetical protein n=1 Tax=Actinocorallia sp. B10E7 TaxID=3153558 RepID=UPI00325CBC94